MELKFDRHYVLASSTEKVPDSPANSPDTCGRKAYPGRKSCGFQNIRKRVEAAFNSLIWSFYAVVKARAVKKCTKM